MAATTAFDIFATLSDADLARMTRSAYASAALAWSAYRAAPMRGAFPPRLVQRANAQGADAWYYTLKAEADRRCAIPAAVREFDRAAAIAEAVDAGDAYADLWVTAAGGTEEPTLRAGGRWMLYQWNPQRDQHRWLDLETLEAGPVEA